MEHAGTVLLVAAHHSAEKPLIVEPPQGFRSPKTISNRPILRLAVGVIVGGIAAWLAFRRTDLRSLADGIARAHPLFVLAAVVSVLLTLVTVAIRWHVVLYAGERHRSRARLLWATALGQMLNIILPIRLGELARAYMVSRAEGVAAARVLLTVAAEKLADLTMLGVATAIVLVFVSAPAWVAAPGRAVLITGALAALGSWLLTWRAERLGRWMARLVTVLPSRWQESVLSQTEAGLESLRALRSGHSSASFWLLSVAVLVLAASTNYLMFLAFGMKLPAIAALTVLVVVQVGTAAVSVPGNIGVFHYLTVLTLGAFGVEGQLALAYAVLLHLVALGPKVLLGTAVLVLMPHALMPDAVWRYPRQNPS